MTVPGEEVPQVMWPQVPYRYADKYVFHCDCVGAGHYLEVLWDDDDPEFRYLMLEEGWRPRTLKERLRGAWRMLWGRTVMGDGILLDEVNASALQRVLAKHHPLISANGTTWTLSYGSTQATDFGGNERN